MDGRLFVDWTPFEHPTLGPVEIGGFLWKIYDAKTKTYTNVQCLPGPVWEKTLDNHTKWHLYLIEQSPLLRIANTDGVDRSLGPLKHLGRCVQGIVYDDMESFRLCGDRDMALEDEMGRYLPRRTEDKGCRIRSPRLISGPLAEDVSRIGFGLQGDDRSRICPHTGRLRNQGSA